MKKEEIIKEKRFSNEYGNEEVYSLKKEYSETSSGAKYNEQYIVHYGCYIEGHYSCGYYRTYKRLVNAMKDSYVEKYLKDEE